MTRIWDKVYYKDSAFFGEGSSNFSQICYGDFKKHHVKKLLELGCGQGRETLFYEPVGMSDKTSPLRRFYHTLETT